MFLRIIKIKPDSIDIMIIFNCSNELNVITKLHFITSVTTV